MGLSTVAVVAVGLCVGAVLLLRTPRLVPGRPRPGAGEHIVVIPARDEADVLPALLADLAAQTAPARRVVVVDDGSRDATAAVAAAAGAEVRSCPPTPPGWNPKSWAVHQGVAGADEDRLVLLDADVRLDPEAVAAVLATLDQHGGLVSVAPRHDTGSAAERLSLPFNLVAVMGAGAGWHPADPSARAAFGPCLAIGRHDHAAVGGHAAGRGDLLDDVALAHRARAAGLPVSLFRGGPLVRYRMYRQGARQVLDGWTKNIAAGARRTPPLAGLGVASWVTALLVPLASLASARSWAAAAAAAALWAVVGVHTTALSRGVGRFGSAGLAAPLLAIAFVAVVARSAVALALGRPVRWKGRDLVQPRGEAARG